MRTNPGLGAIARLLVAVALIVHSIDRTALAADVQPVSIVAMKVVAPVRTTLAPSPKTQSQPIPFPTVRTAMPQSVPSKKRGFLKWVLIGAAAGTAAVIFTRQKDTATDASASLTVGTPVVGQPE